MTDLAFLHRRSSSTPSISTPAHHRRPFIYLAHRYRDDETHSVDEKSAAAREIGEPNVTQCYIARKSALNVVSTPFGPDRPMPRLFQHDRVFGTLRGKAVGSFQKDDGLRSLLFRAGYRSPSSVAMFHGVQLAAGITLALVCDWIVLLQGSGAGSLLIPAFCGLGFGYLIPKRFLEWQVKSRAHRLRSALPPALDLIVLALEAGQTIDHGIIEAARSSGRVYPDLSSELTFCSLEMRAGTPRGEALRRMGERCGEEEIRKLVTVLVDSERFGSSLGPALRSHAHYLRTTDAAPGARGVPQAHGEAGNAGLLPDLPLGAARYARTCVSATTAIPRNAAQTLRLDLRRIGARGRPPRPAELRIAPGVADLERERANQILHTSLDTGHHNRLLASQFIALRGSRPTS
jgi:hypothetical protein